MKKTIIAAIILLAMLLTSCTDANSNGDNTENVDNTTENVQTTPAKTEIQTEPPTKKPDIR